jgi:hypothetical protein
MQAGRRRDTLIRGGGQDSDDARAGPDLVLDRDTNEIVIPIQSKKRRAGS